jgi:UDP-N-acetylglucosamine 2-epimerase (non-hydrolysing)
MTTIGPSEETHIISPVVAVVESDGRPTCARATAAVVTSGDTPRPPAAWRVRGDRLDFAPVNGRKKIIHVVGARPNFMKIAPVMRAVARAGFAEQKLVHTGQHYDVAMSDVFFTDLGMPVPDIHLGVGSGSHAEQTAKVMTGFEKVCLAERPDLVVVAGDVNSTLACAVDCAKLRVPCAHVEAGLRSFDLDMPEEVNRIVTDRLCEILLTPSPDGDENLLREGTDPSRIFRVGNVMIDTLLSHLPKARATGSPARLNVAPGTYAVLTLHRPSNVDDRSVLRDLLEALGEVQRKLPIVFPVHPRTRRRIEEFGLGPTVARLSGLHLCDPLGYLEFLGLSSQAKLVLTDSGGLQEETTALGIPCLTLRENTERPITLTEGTNVLVGVDRPRIVDAANRVLDGHGKSGRVPALWDGKASERIAEVFRTWSRS